MTNRRFHEERITRLRASLEERGLDAMVILDRVNTYYLTGFECTYSILVIDSEQALFVTDSRYGEAAERDLSWLTVRIQPNQRVAGYLADLLGSLGHEKVGYEGRITVDQLDNLSKWFPVGVRLENAGALVTALRSVKGAEEIECIRRAVDLADRMMALAQERARPGVTERELSRLIRFSSEELGGSGESFPNIVASGPNSSVPHHHPGARTLAAGDALTLDMGAIVEGYCSDLTRNPFIGSVSPELEKVYATVLRANEAAISAIRPGMTGPEVDAIARDVIDSAGYGAYFGHGLGHGVGLEIHEAPRLSPSADSHRLEAGNIVTIEPGIYVPGLGGVRIEDYVLLTEGGAEVLSKAPRDLCVLPA